MALTGIQIYKLLPQTNCKDCGYPTCLAFAMKLAAKQAELSACPHVSEASKSQLAESAAPPIRLIGLKANGSEVKAGNEVVLFRHEKTFYHRPGVFIRIRDNQPVEELRALVQQAESYSTNYVGIDLTIDGFAVESISSDADCFSGAVQIVRSESTKPLILISTNPSIMVAAMKVISAGERPLLSAATESNCATRGDGREPG